MIVPDEEESDDRIIIANVQVLKEKIIDGEDGITDPDSYADTSRQVLNIVSCLDRSGVMNVCKCCLIRNIFPLFRPTLQGILSLGNDKITATGHDIEKCWMGDMEARKFLVRLITLCVKIPICDDACFVLLDEASVAVDKGQ